MKLHEIDFECRNKKYAFKSPDGVNTVCRVSGNGENILIVGGKYDAYCLDEAYRLRQISEFDFEEYVDWENVKIDTPIWVRNSNVVNWLPRHFAKYEDDEVFAFNHGKTSHATNMKDIALWKYARLDEPSEEELE